MGKIIGFTIGGLGGVTLISIILNAILALLVAQTYSSLSKESLIALIKFDKVPGQEKTYIAHIYSDTEEKIGDYTIYGDQWRMDAGFIKMKYWANILGVDSKYTLDRFEGRYVDINDENTKKHEAYQLESHTIIDTFSFFIDTTYGSSVYKDIELNTKYTVLKSQTGLMVREEKIVPEVKEKSIYDKTVDFFSFK